MYTLSVQVNANRMIPAKCRTQWSRGVRCRGPARWPSRCQCGAAGIPGPNLSLVPEGRTPSPTTSQVPRPRDVTDSPGMAETTQHTETIRRIPPRAEDSDSRGVRNSRQPGTHCPTLLMAPHSVAPYGEHRVSMPRVTRCSWPCVRSPASEVMKSSDLDETMLRLAATAHLGRYSGVSWTHSESDLRIFFTWCGERDLAPLAARREQIELYVRWMQEARRFKPSTVSRRPKRSIALDCQRIRQKSGHVQSMRRTSPVVEHAFCRVRR